MNRIITESLQFTKADALLHKIRAGINEDVNIVWKQFEEKVMALSDIVNYVPAFKACMYQGFDEFRKDNVQYMEVNKSSR